LEVGPVLLVGVSLYEPLHALGFAVLLLGRHELFEQRSLSFLGGARIIWSFLLSDWYRIISKEAFRDSALIITYA